MKVTKILIVLMISLSMISCNNQFKKVTKLENEIDSVSYALGLNLSAQIKSNFEEINRDIYIQAFMDGLDSTNLLMDAAKTAREDEGDAGEAVKRGRSKICR